jgi:hypothetical protein
MQCSAVAVKILVSSTFTNEKRVDEQFLYGSCDRSSRAAVGEHRSQSHIAKHLRRHGRMLSVERRHGDHVQRGSAISTSMGRMFSANKQANKQTPWSETACELYRPSSRRFSAKWLPTFADKGCHVVSVTDPYGRILGL